MLLPGNKLQRQFQQNKNSDFNVLNLQVSNRLHQAPSHHANDGLTEGLGYLGT